MNLRTPEEALYDAVYAALETGNPAAAREALAEAAHTIPNVCTRLRREILVQYGTQL